MKHLDNKSALVRQDKPTGTAFFFVILSNKCIIIEDHKCQYDISSDLSQ